MAWVPWAVSTYPAMVGAVLAARRRELRLRQSSIASSVGLNVSTWSRIENGETALTIEQLAVAAEALGLPPSVLLRAVDTTVAANSKQGWVTTAKRADAEVVSGALYLARKLLRDQLGPINWCTEAVPEYQLYSKPVKRRKRP